MGIIPSALICNEHSDLPTAQVEFYGLIQFAVDKEVIDNLDADQLHNKHYPALRVLEETSIDLADIIWGDIDGDGEKDFNWAPLVVSNSVKRGIRAGYSWAKAELANG